MITSAGCNALDYLLDDPAEIHAMDVNFRQNAVLELKLALIRRENFDDLFEFFGIGSHERLQNGLPCRPAGPAGDARRFFGTSTSPFSIPAA